MKFLDPCVVPYLVVTLTLYHGLLQLKMKENDPILMYSQLNLSDVQAGYEKETSCLTTIKNHVIKYCEKVYERSGKNLFWSIKNSCEVLNKLKSRGFRASSLSTYDFSTLYTTLPHNLIKDK